jgi:hypothetical protein
MACAGAIAETDEPREQVTSLHYLYPQVMLLRFAENHSTLLPSRDELIAQYADLLEEQVGFGS